MPLNLLGNIWEKTLKGKTNVIGYSKKLRKRIRNGKEVDEDVVRVYVSKKMPPKALNVDALIPPFIIGVPTDIVEIGEMKAPPQITSPLGVTQRMRPLVAGISIGNLSITAGTLGWFFEKSDKTVLGSNAHVFATNSLSDVCGEKKIVQPGSYDGGKDPDDLVAEYLWHQQLYGGISNCVPSGLARDVLNGILKLSRARTRFSIYVSGENYVDFALATPTVDYDMSLHTTKEVNEFIGLGFAGSDTSSYICKASRIIDTGWKPCDVDIATPIIGNEVHKIGRTSEYTSATIIDDCVHGIVSYGELNNVEFDDLVLTEKLLEGGDSGSSCWLKIERD